MKSTRSAAPTNRSRLLLRLAQGILPNELILEIFSHFVLAKLPIFSTRDPRFDKITNAAQFLLSPLIPGTASLLPLLEQAITETSLFVDLVRFTRRGPSVPTWANNHIRHLQLKFEYELSGSPMGRAVYPSQLLRATQAISSLAQIFPNLHSLEIVLDFEVVFCGLNVLAVLGGEVRSGWQEVKTWRDLAEEFIEAVRPHWSSAKKRLVVKIKRWDERGASWETMIDGRGAAEILDQVGGVVGVEDV